MRLSHPVFVFDTWEPGGSDAAGPDPSESGFESQHDAHASLMKISYFVQAAEDVALLVLALERRPTRLVL